jgi:hypothetical protein
MHQGLQKLPSSLLLRQISRCTSGSLCPDNEDSGLPRGLGMDTRCKWLLFFTHSEYSLL